MVRLSDVGLLIVLPCSHLCIRKFYINVIWWFFHLQKLHISSILSNNEEKQWHNTRQYTIKFHMISKAFQIFWIQINITCDNTSSHDCTESWSTVLPWCALPPLVTGKVLSQPLKTWGVGSYKNWKSLFQKFSCELFLQFSCRPHQDSVMWKLGITNTVSRIRQHCISFSGVSTG